MPLNKKKQRFSVLCVNFSLYLLKFRLSGITGLCRCVLKPSCWISNNPIITWQWVRCTIFVWYSMVKSLPQITKKKKKTLLDRGFYMFVKLNCRGKLICIKKFIFIKKNSFPLSSNSPDKKRYVVVEKMSVHLSYLVGTLKSSIPGCVHPSSWTAPFFSCLDSLIAHAKESGKTVPLKT